MNIYRKFLTFVLCIFMTLSLFYADAKATLKDTGITDSIGVISDETKLYITNRNNSLFSKTGAKIMFVITNNADNNLRDYANNLFLSEDLDNFGKKNSVLIVISDEDKDYWAKSSVSVKKSLTDKLLGEYLVSAFEPYFAQNNYNEGIVNLYDAVSSWYMEHYELTDLNDVIVTESDVDTKDDKSSPLEVAEKILFIIALILVFGVIVLYIIKYLVKSELKRRRKEPTNIIDHTNMDEIIDDLITKPEPKKEIKIFSKFKNNEKAQDVISDDVIISSDIQKPDKENKKHRTRYKFSADIDIEKEFADIDIDDIISKNTSTNK